MLATIGDINSLEHGNDQLKLRIDKMRDRIKKKFCEDMIGVFVVCDEHENLKIFGTKQEAMRYIDKKYVYMEDIMIKKYVGKMLERLEFDLIKDYLMSKVSKDVDLHVDIR